MEKNTYTGCPRVVSDIDKHRGAGMLEAAELITRLAERSPTHATWAEAVSGTLSALGRTYKGEARGDP